MSKQSIDCVTEYPYTNTHIDIDTPTVSVNHNGAVNDSHEVGYQTHVKQQHDDDDEEKSMK